MRDVLFRVGRFRLFNVIDDFNREAVAIEIDTSLRPDRLVRVFERLKAEPGLPDMLRVDNGQKFLGQTPWVACHPSSMHNVTWKTPLLNCLLDGGAYATVEKASATIKNNMGMISGDVRKSVRICSSMFSLTDWFELH